MNLKAHAEDLAYYCIVKILANKDCSKPGRKNFGKLKSSCIGNVMKIGKIGEKLGKMP